MLGELEHLQSVLEDIVKQTKNPTVLPPAGEDLVREFRLSDHHNYDDQVNLIITSALVEKYPVTAT